MPNSLFSQRKTSKMSPLHRFQPSSLRRAAGLGLGLLSLGLTLGQSAHAGTVTWDGTAADWFSNPSHWVGGGYPGSGDDAQNNTTAAMTLGQNTTIQSFFSDGAFTLQGGNFSGSLANAAGTIQVNAVFTDNGGQINNFTVNQGTGGSLLFTGSNNNSLSNSIINSSLNVAEAGNDSFLRLFGTDTINGVLTLGTVNSNDGYGLRLNNGATLVIGSNGSFQGYGDVSQEVSASTVTNNGTVNANSNGNVLTLNQTNFTNTGTTEATNGGTFTLNSSTTANSGAVKAVGAGSIVNITGAFTGTGTAAAGNLFTASTGGQIFVNNASLLGTINTDANTNLFIGSSNSNNLSNTTVNGNLNVAETGNDSFLRLYGTDTINGVLTLGTINSNDGYGLRLNNGATLVISSGSTLQGYGDVSQEVSASALTNNGTVNANSAGNVLTFNQSTFTNTGTAEATNGGTLTLSNANSLVTTNSVGATLAAIGTGSILNIAGTFTGIGNNLLTASGGGQIFVNNASLLGTINTDANTNLFIGSSNSNNLSNTTVNGNLNVAEAGNDSFLRLYGTDTINGVLTLGTINSNDGYGLRLNNGATLVISSGSTLQGYGDVSQEVSASALTNNGTVNANSAGNVLTFNQSTFTNTGTAEATNGGTLTLSNVNSLATANSGAVKAVGAGSIVNITGTFTGTGTAAAGNLLTASTGGQFFVNNASLLGTINTDANTNLFIGSSGNNNLTNTTVNGNLNVAEAGNDSFLRLYGTDTINGVLTLGTINSNDGYGLRLNNGATLVISSGSTLQGYGDVSQEVSASSLTNNGTVNANSNSNVLTLNQSTFTNNGTAEATNGGTLSLTNTTAENGALNAIGTNSVIDITGSFTGAVGSLITASGGGQFFVNNASLLGTINTDANTTLFIGSGGNNLSGTTVNGNLNVAEAGNDSFLRLYGTDTINGALTLGTVNGSDGYGLRLNNQANLVIGSNGTLQGFGDVSDEVSASTVTNNGTVNANSAGNTLTFNQANFTNTGTTEVQNGAALVVNSANTDSGNILVKTGGTATFSKGVTQTAGVTQADGTLTSALTLTGGTLQGTGTVTGTVINNGGTVAAGDSAPGTLAISGPFTQASGGTLDVQFTNSASSLLTVSGLFSADGTLDVNYLDSALYTGGTTPFTFLTYGTLAATTNGLGLTQYFTNEIADSNTTGLIDGHNGFTYELINNTAINSLQLEVLTSGAPVPEASTTVSLGLLLGLGGAGLWRVKRRAASSAK